MERLGHQFQLAAALLPVTTFRIPMTMRPSGALRVVRALRPDVVIPIHLGIQPRSPLLRTSKGQERATATSERLVNWSKN
jgi:L-ascorbate metabolism protein UlaG (beta-lactamase superfamily)